MVHKPIAIMILPVFVSGIIFVAGIMMLGILAATANAADDNNTGGGETQAPPAGGGETQAPPAGGGETQAPPATETPPPAAPPAGASQENNSTGNAAASQTSNNTDFVNTILQIHNRERAAVGVPPLVWSDSLAAGAKTWADHLAAIDKAVHSTTQGYGENIAWRGPPGKDTLPLMVESWVAEKNGYNVAPFQWDRDVAHAHYTAMVWRTTTEIGCGMATNSVHDYVVCRFTPGGNVNGQSPY